VVLTPFDGIGSEAVVALEMGRRAVAVELKGSYYQQMKANCERAAKSEQLDMFEDIEIAEQTAK
jgi:DNA modification methylase